MPEMADGQVNPNDGAFAQASDGITDCLFHIQNIELFP
jgi:hypothetical protein